MKFLIPIFFLLFFPALNADAVIYADKKPSSLDSYFIETEEEKTVENIIKYYDHFLDDSYSELFLEKIAEYGYNTAHWKFFSVEQENPLLLIRISNDVHLPDIRGLTDVFRIDHRNDTWITKQGIEYERNDFGSFKRITPITIDKTCNEKYQVAKRTQCDFDGMKELEELKSQMYLKSHYPNLFVENFSEIDNVFSYKYSEIDHRTQFLMDNGLLEFTRGQ